MARKLLHTFLPSFKNQDLYSHLQEESADEMTGIVAAREILCSHILSRLNLENVSEEVQKNLREKIFKNGWY